jgi:type II secretory pathway component GspD/PulD (secretin)
MLGASHPFRRSSPPPRLKHIALWVCVATASAGPAIAAASQPGWFERPFHYVVINQDVRGILTEFGRNVGVPVILSDKVGGRVRGDVVARAKNAAQAPTAGEFLKQLSEANALTWYFDGSILYLSADQEFSTQLIDVSSLSPEAIVAELKRLSLLDERFSVRSSGNAGLISASGPPAFIAIVRQVVDKMRPPAAVAGDDPRVRVFRGGAPAEVVRARSASALPQDGGGQVERQIEARREPGGQR